MNTSSLADRSILESWVREEKSPPRAKPSWALMGDISGFRGGVPEHLIQWRRAAGEEDPEPQL